MWPRQRKAAAPLIAEAEAFLTQFHGETPGAGPLAPRIAQVRRDLTRTGTYTHTPAELEWAVRVAWRNSARCIGRLYWRSLKLRDRREVTDADVVAAECAEHLREATRNGKIRCTITIFAPDTPEAPGPRILSEQLIRYAGHRTAEGRVLGDPRCVMLTDHARSLGWQPERPGPFDVLPLIVQGTTGPPQAYELPRDAVLEVLLRHPDYPWFGRLGLRWHAVPAISNMVLRVGGISYPAAPFNGWYLGTEIGARNLADVDRYDLLPVIAEQMELDTSSPRTLWRDRAMVELTRAVHHSFDADGVSMADHHDESERFLTHLAKEEEAGRACPAEWSWIVPPMSASQTPVFHRYYDDPSTAAGPSFCPHATAQPS